MLSNASQAVVDPSKVRDYLLSSSHPVGRFKAAIFFALGYSQLDWETLSNALLVIAQTGDARSGEPSTFGQKYEVSAMLNGPNGRSRRVKTIWLVESEASARRFVTAYPE